MNDLFVGTAKFGVNGDHVAREEGNDETGRDEETHVVAVDDDAMAMNVG